MAVVLVYNEATGRVERYIRGEMEPMPYNEGRTLTVREFRALSASNTLWTSVNVMRSWNGFRKLYGKPIYVGACFKRIWEGGHAGQSQHYAGCAFDVGQNLNNEERAQMRMLAQASNLWSYVEPASLTPGWVHLSAGYGVPACARGGYPLMRVGSRGNYVLVLQDALNSIGYATGGLDGIYGNATRDAVTRFQRNNGLAEDGIAGCETIRRITSKAVGIGKTRTVVEG